MSMAQEIVVLLEEEYGYRHWVWIPEMSAEELKEWWQAMPTVASYFYDGPTAFPGKIHQVYYEPSWHKDLHGADSVGLQEDEFFFVKEEGCRELVPLSSSMTLPKDRWTAHLHMDCDTYLTPPDGEVIRHAGYIPQDEYYSEDYQASQETEDAWGEALMGQLQKIIKEEADGDSSDDRILEEPS